MVYKFIVGSEESENFRLEILIDSEDTFMRLRNTILDAAGYTKDNADSFNICDEEWRKEAEVTAMDMGLDNDDDEIWLMDETRLEDLIDEEGQRLKFIFDNLTERHFYMKLVDIEPMRSLHDPILERKEGRPPKQTVETEIFDTNPKNVASPTIEEIDVDDEFFGMEGYNDDELENFSELDRENIQ